MRGSQRASQIIAGRVSGEQVTRGTSTAEELPLWFPQSSLAEATSQTGLRCYNQSPDRADLWKRIARKVDVLNFTVQAFEENDVS